MLKITTQGNSLIVEGVKNGTYPTDGVCEYPKNSLIAVTDESEMVTFRSAATNDVLFSGKVEDITINEESVTKDNILSKFDAVSNAPQGGGGGGGSVDAYTKAESDAKYGTKAEQESLRGDVENALGEIAALGYDKADKKDVYTKTEVDEKLGDVKGGDEHYRSIATEGMDDAPIITVVNGEIFTPDPIPSYDGYNLTFYTDKKFIFKRSNTSAPKWSINTFSGQTTFATWDSSKNCLVFNSNELNFEGVWRFVESIWKVNGNVIKEQNEWNFKQGAELHFGNEWSESDVLTFENMSGDSWGMYFQFDNFGFAYEEYITPRPSYKTIDNAIEVDFRGNKYHLLPKEQLKTINGQSIVGTGNLTVTDSSTKEYSYGDKLTSGTYYRINGSAISIWNNAKTNADDYEKYVKDHFTYRSGYNNPTNKSKNVLVREYLDEKIYDYQIAIGDYNNGNYGFTSTDQKLFIISDNLENAIPTHIVDITKKSGSYTFMVNNQYGTRCEIVDGVLEVDKRYQVTSEDSYGNGLEWYESDTKDGVYTKVELKIDKYQIKPNKWYKIVQTDYNTFYGRSLVDSGFFDNYNIFEDAYTSYGNTITVDANETKIVWNKTDIDNSLYYQDGSEFTPILTQKNISKYVDIQGGGGGETIDAYTKEESDEKYPTKQEVNQTYLQKTGEYVKNVTANGGSINFEKGNGTPDVVNFKTINNQSIIGMDNIKVPTDTDIESKVNNVLSEQLWQNDDALAVTEIGFWEDENRMIWTKSTLDGTNPQSDSQYFKTINGQSILGQGDIVVSGGGSIDMSDYYTKQQVDNLIPKIWSGTQSEYDRLATHYEDTLYLIKEDDNTSGGGDAGGYL